MQRNNAIALTLFVTIAIAILTGWCLWKVCYRCVQAKAYDIQMHKKSMCGSDIEAGGSSKGSSKASSKVSEISEAKKAGSKKSEKKEESKKGSEMKEESKKGSEKAASKAPTAQAWDNAGWGAAAPAANGGGEWAKAAEGATPKGGW
jgi:hypothetical protein